MTTRNIRLTSLALIAGLFLSGCASTKDGRTTQAQATGGGAVLGAIAGGLLGYALNGADGAARGAMIGAGVGAAGGFAYGSQVAKKKAKYTKQEDFLDYAVAQADQNHTEAVASNQKLLAEVESLEKRYGAVAATDKKSKKKLDAEYKLQLTNIDKASTKLDAQIKDYNECLNGVGYGDKPQSAALRTKIKDLEVQKANALKYKTRLASTQTRIAI